MCFGIEYVVIEGNAILVCKNKIQVFEGFGKEETTARRGSESVHGICIKISVATYLS